MPVRGQLWIICPCHTNSRFHLSTLTCRVSTCSCVCQLHALREKVIWKDGVATLQANLVRMFCLCLCLGERERRSQFGRVSGGLFRCCLAPPRQCLYADVPRALDCANQIALDRIAKLQSTYQQRWHDHIRISNEDVVGDHS